MSKDREERVLACCPCYLDGKMFVVIPSAWIRFNVPNWGPTGPKYYPLEDYGRRDPESGCRIFEREDALVSVMRERFGG